MTYKPPYESFRKAQRRRKVYGPIIIGGIALILAGGGIFLIWQWVAGSGGIKFSLFNTATPTATETATPMPPTATPTETPIPSATIPPTEAATATASAPFPYTVESGDTLSSIAEKFDVESAFFLQQFNNLTSDSLYAGQELIIPDPNTGLPTETPLPENLPSGYKIEYTVQPGDYLALIAQKFNTTEDAILENNDIENTYQIYPGQVLVVPINMVTPTFGPSPTAENVTPSPTP
jgi:LysM repeat protein